MPRKRKGTRCTCGSRHKTYGECLRAKNIAVTFCRSAAGWDLTSHKQVDTELDRYRSARKQGIQPDGTGTRAVNRALEISDATGVAYDGGEGVA